MSQTSSISRSAGLLGALTPLATAGFTVAAVAAATVGAALFFEHVLGYRPCALCLQERIPYYAAVPLGLAVGFAGLNLPERWARAGLWLIAAIFLAGAALGVYHAGAEWKWWAGPADCGGAIAAPTSAADLLKSIENVKVIRCDEASWRFAGLSFAGWNAVISAWLAFLSGIAAKR